MFASRLPDGQKHTLALVVAGAVLVRFAEVAQADRAVDGAEDFADANLTGRAGEHVAATDAALGPHQSGAFQCKQDLLQIWLRNRSAFGNVADRCRPDSVVVQRE